MTLEIVGAIGLGEFGFDFRKPALGILAFTLQNLADLSGKPRSVAFAFVFRVVIFDGKEQIRIAGLGKTIRPRTGQPAPRKRKRRPRHHLWAGLGRGALGQNHLAPLIQNIEIAPLAQQGEHQFKAPVPGLEGQGKHSVLAP